MPSWSAQFEALLRPYLRELSDDQPLLAGKPLADLGLDSLSTVSLLIGLEQNLCVVFPDEKLTAETFETAGVLWSVVVELLSATGGETSYESATGR